MMGVFWSFLLHQSFGCVFPLCHTLLLSLPKTLCFMFWLFVLCYFRCLYVSVLMWFSRYVTCSAIIGHFDPETHFEFYTLMERRDSYLSNDASIVFVLRMLRKVRKSKKKL